MTENQPVIDTDVKSEQLISDDKLKSEGSASVADVKNAF